MAVEYRIYEDTFPIDLQQVGRMPEPYQYIALWYQRLQVCAHVRYGVRRHLPGSFAEQKATKDGQHIDAFGEVGRRFQVLECSVAVIRGAFHALQPFPGRGFAKLWLPHK